MVDAHNDNKWRNLLKPLHKEHANARWNLPDYPWYKINLDAAVFSNTKAMGIGVVVLDHEGLVLAALSKRIPLPLGPLVAKARAMYQHTLWHNTPKELTLLLLG